MHWVKKVCTRNNYIDITYCFLNFEGDKVILNTKNIVEPTDVAIKKLREIYLCQTLKSHIKLSLVNFILIVSIKVKLQHLYSQFQRLDF